MINSSTVFVVGAGASKEAGLPTGNELTATIANMLDIKFDDFDTQSSGDPLIFQALRKHVREQDGVGGNIYQYQQAGWFIKNAMPLASSIDSFIETHQDNEKVKLCGKLAIVRSILEAEKNSLLCFNEQNPNAKLNFESLERTWYRNSFQLLVDGCAEDNWRNLFNNVSFIIFNYDRCVEHFLYNAVQTYFGIGPDEAVILMSGLTFFHPYGVVGYLPWQHKADFIPFGGGVGDLLSLAGQIKTYSERIEDVVAITNLHRHLIGAETIVFLGFAFHDENMELMTTGAANKLQKVFATAIGISDSDSGVIQDKIISVFCKKGNKIPIYFRQNLYCYQMFDEYLRTLSQ